MRRNGFVLILVLALLTMLLVVVAAFSLLNRTGSQIAAASVNLTRARQNALLALTIAVGRLDEVAADDPSVTAMAGVAGVQPGDRHRQWCGVWTSGGAGPVWLVSGAASSLRPILAPGMDPVTIVGPGSVGTEATDKEFVEVGREAIAIASLVAEGRVTTGSYAWWVGDEGCKAAAFVPQGWVQRASDDGAILRPNLRRLLGTGYPSSPEFGSAMQVFEQLRLAGSGISLLNAFHSVSYSPSQLPSAAPFSAPGPDGRVRGTFNVNTTSESVWRAWLEFPDQAAPAFGLTSSRSLSAARAIRDRIAARGRPFVSIAELAASQLIQSAFDAASPRITSVTQEDFFRTLGPVLTVRSDTFRVRAHGEALSGAADSRPATAWCEAVVERRPSGGPPGHRFVVTVLRWLSPDEI